MKKVLRNGDYEKYMALNAQFHSLFRELNDNEWIIKISHMLSKQARILTALSLSLTQRHSASIREHAAIADAYKKGDPRALNLAVRKHLKNFKENIIKSYDSLEVKEKI
jgi:DNA-binding GntR family transcriptional regulator